MERDARGKRIGVRQTTTTRTWTAVFTLASRCAPAPAAPAARATRAHNSNSNPTSHNHADANANAHMDPFVPRTKSRSGKKGGKRSTTKSSLSATSSTLASPSPPPYAAVPSFAHTPTTLRLPLRGGRGFDGTTRGFGSHALPAFESGFGADVEEEEGGFDGAVAREALPSPGLHRAKPRRLLRAADTLTALCTPCAPRLPPAHAHAALPLAPAPTPPFPPSGPHDQDLPNRYQPIEGVDEMDGMPHEHELHGHTRAWKTEVLKASEVDLAFIALCVTTHRLRVRNGPHDEVLANVTFPTVAVDDYDCGSDEPDVARKGTRRTTHRCLFLYF
ncbi:hypothetical protein B0H11DRAFT_2265476 [Mycena galericulata]|nr:hypothetical protein B0H11DRAFT_2265476 [Mycena galericulata]